MFLNYFPLWTSSTLHATRGLFRNCSSHGFREPAPDTTKPTREIHPYNSASLEPLLVLQSVVVRDVIEKIYKSKGHLIDKLS